MANSPQAKKRARQSETRRQLKSSQRSSLRTAIKGLQHELGATNAQGSAEKLLKVVKLADSLKNKKVVHPNKVARIKSRLNKKVKALATA